MNAEPSFPIDVNSQEHPNILAAPKSQDGLVSWLRQRRWFLIFVLAPTILATIYYGLIASDIYVSESRFVIKSPSDKKAQSSTLANLIQTTGLSGGQEQTNEVLEFVRSRDALRALEQDTSIRAKFSAPNGDFLSRFPFPFTDRSFENLYKYYTKHVTADLETETSTAMITVEAFTPHDARAINEHLLDVSEALVNRLNARAQTNGISEAQKQVELATRRAKEARVALAQYRNQQAIIDPAKQAVGVIEIANTMIAQRAALQAQLDQMQRVAPGNPSIPALRQRIGAISAQIGAQDSRVTGSNNGIASKLGGYENLMVEQEFATQSLNVASAALVQARSDAVRQKFYLERIVDPNLPDAPLLPHRFLAILTVAATALALYFVGWMLLTGILEHAPED